MECYFCGGKVTGVAHIPPRSFFPKGKRQNLITVDSCNIHNQVKSKEDEYIRAVLLSSIKLDEQDQIIELRNTNTRALERCVKRAFERVHTKEQAKEIIEITEKYKDMPIGEAKTIDEIVSKGILNLGLVGLLNNDVREETVVDSSGEEVSTTSFIYDRTRFDAFFECMARGIYFYEIGKRWEGIVNILPHTFLKDDAPQKDKDLSHEFLRHFDLLSAKGAQKEYFCYEGANWSNPDTGKIDNIFFNFCLFNTFYFTAIFPIEI